MTRILLAAVVAVVCGIFVATGSSSHHTGPNVAQMTKAVGVTDRGGVAVQAVSNANMPVALRQKRATNTRQLDVSTNWNWWYLQVHFTKTETQAIAWGYGAVGAKFGWTSWMALAAYAMPTAASWATSHGYCLAMNFYWFDFVTGYRTPLGYAEPWYYRC